MKKALVLASIAAVTSVPGAASAIDTFAGPRPVRIAGLAGATLGTVEFAALGRMGDYCRYLMIWESPFNPNDVQLCDVRERRTLLHPSCIQNRLMNIPTITQAGPQTAVRTRCSGFDALGDHVDKGDLNLFLAAPDKQLTGIVIFPWGVALPVEIR